MLAAVFFNKIYRKLTANLLLLNNFLKEILKRIYPNYLAETNAMMFFVWILALIASSILLKEYYIKSEKISLYTHMVFWLWMTVFFSVIADYFAQLKFPWHELQHAKVGNEHTKLVRVVKNLTNLDKFKYMPLSNVSSRHYILLESGDKIPCDGYIVRGKSYVSQTDLTGQIGDVFKSANTDADLIKGSILQGSGEILVMKPTFAKDKSFFTRASIKLENIHRSAIPSELALQRLILGLSILFIAVILAVYVIAQYFAINLPAIYVIDLVVILLPTTITGLTGAITTSAKTQLAKDHDIIVHDHTALDNAADIQLALIDKTGTITTGLRQMVKFHKFTKLEDSEIYNYLFLSSYLDNTYEGKSVVEFAAKKKGRLNVAMEECKWHKFSSSNPISGVDCKDIEIRKGSVNKMLQYLDVTYKDLPKPVIEKLEEIAKRQGTALLFTANREIMGIIELLDKFKPGSIAQLDKLRKSGIKIILLTGDSENNAKLVAKKICADDYYADCTPEKKMLIVQKFQNLGYVVAMCGDGVNDALAMAQADIGYIYAGDKKIEKILQGNIFTRKNDLSSIIQLRNICRKMALKRGALTVFSLVSDIAKYFVIIPALFSTVLPVLSVLNFMNFHSLHSVILSSVMFNALVILLLMPFALSNRIIKTNRKSLWQVISIFGLLGMITPFIMIKLFDMLIVSLGIV